MFVVVLINRLFYSLHLTNHSHAHTEQNAAQRGAM